ncbi:TonB-dependent receptor [Acidobacteria bacterium AH-259-G07]|nr:TonB-dependent receptor [Acidobacteria bacterium AH-259-G07]
MIKIFKTPPMYLTLFGLCLVLALSWIAPTRIHAQALYGAILGNVVDVTGGAIPGAEVTVINVDTNYTQSTITGDTGTYSLLNVPRGTYTLTVSLTGFREYVAQNVSITVGDVTREDVTLQVGEITEQVTVSAAVTALQTDTTDVHTRLETREITDLPLGAYRNYQTLINLSPGATPARFQNAVTDTPARALSTNINGTARNNNNTRIDGSQSINIWLPHHTGYVPPAETIEEVNISTNNFDAEQGFAGGAATTLITKSGTNDFHGTVFALHENSAVSAKDFFLVGDKPVGKRNIDGFAVGGPIVQDKLFFFGGFEATLERIARTSTSTVATAEQRAGDFSSFSTTIYDPLTGVDGTGRTPFPNNQIPANRMSSAALKMQDLMPLPNLGGLTSNHQVSGTQVLDRYNTDIKIDWYRSDEHRIWGKWSWMDATVAKGSKFGPGGGGAIGGGGDGEGLTDIIVYGFGHNWTLSPTFLIDGNWGLTDMDQQVLPADLDLGNFGQDVLGIPGTNATDPQSCPEGRCGGIPRFSISGFTSFGQVDGWSPIFRDEDSYTFTHNFSWIRSNHEFRFGYDVVKLNLTHWQPEIGGGPRGRFDFGRSITATKEGTAGTDQNAYAAFLVGQPSRIRKSLQWEEMTTREWQHAWYFRDRWQATPKLTLTLGLRWEYYPLVTRADRPMEQLDFDTMKLSLSNNIEVSNSLLAPRLGFAYRLTDKDVFRMGYGITNDPLPFGRPLRGFYPLTVAGDFDGADSFDPFRNLDVDGIPLFVGPDLGAGVVDLPGFVTQRSMPPDKLTRGYIQSWNVMYERKLPADFVVSTGYVGTQTVHQLADRQLNWAPPGTGSAGRLLRVKFPDRTASTLFWNGWLSGNYHSLQVAVNRRFVNGLFVKGAYTYSRAISMTNDDGWAGLIWNDPTIVSRNRSQTGYNRPHMLNFAALYELPFGQGDGVGNFLLRGWQINGIFSVNEQTPRRIRASSGSLQASRNTQTADQVKADVATLGGIGRGNPYYDRSAFLQVDDVNNPNRRKARDGVCQHLNAAGDVLSTSPANDCYGTSGRNIIRGPTWVNLDLSIFRKFDLKEDVGLEFRVEAFNFANNPKFNNPNTSANSSSFFYITSTTSNSPARVIRFGLKLTF